MEEKSGELETNFEEKLIEAVKMHDCLFNKGAISYRKKTMKNIAWLQVATEVGSDVKDCQHRWRSLRDRFVREMKAQSTPGKTSTTKHNCKWKYLNKLSFLKDHSEPRKFSNSICMTDEETGSNSEHYSKIEYEEDFLEECPGADITLPSASNSPSPEFDAKKRKQESTEEIAFVSFPFVGNSTPTEFAIKRRKEDTKGRNERFKMESIKNEKETATNSRNEDYYRTLDSYMLQLPERLQDDLKIEFLNRVYNEIKK